MHKNKLYSTITYKTIILSFIFLLLNIVSGCATRKIPAEIYKGNNLNDQNLTNDINSKKYSALNNDNITSEQELLKNHYNHNSVYFAFNKDNICATYNGLLSANANWLLSSPQSRLQLQGNTDQIGSIEYNLALGLRRAAKIKDYLIALGSNPKQITVVSWGNLKPIEQDDMKANNQTTNSDLLRAENRRVDLIYVHVPPKGYRLGGKYFLPFVSQDFYNSQFPIGVNMIGCNSL